MKKLIATAALTAALVLPASGAEATPVVEVKDCPPGYIGYVIAVVDRDLVRFCIPFGP
ncbi:MAG TPA: hypothetical protein VHJ76_02525 [Actinomycetota bacterium]|nr:hypothetical protein [Actinomycetota bacterium]